MDRIITLLLLLNFLVYNLQVNISKVISKHYTSSVPADEEKIPNKGLETEELNKLFHQIRCFNSSFDIYYLITKDKRSQQTLHMFPVYWLETFSPPPDFT